MFAKKESSVSDKILSAWLTLLAIEFMTCGLDYIIFNEPLLSSSFLLFNPALFLYVKSLTVSGLLPTNGFMIFAICCTLMGFSAPFYNGVQTALFQEQIQPEYLGRVFGLLGSIMSFAMPLGLVVSGAFADQIGVNRWFLFSGMAILLLAIIALCLPQLRKVDNQKQKS
jgi:DHA3 family macrolide efflux protein-like MFS transporter